MEEITGKKGNLFKALQCITSVSKDLKDQVQKTNLTQKHVIERKHIGNNFLYCYSA